jgi:hypothetical protein
MSTLYLFDSHNASVNNSRVVDVIRGSWSNVPVNGKFFITVPDDVLFDTPPLNAGDLSTAKYTELLTRYPGYTNIAYDDLLTTPVLLGGLLGDRVTAGIWPGGTVQSPPVVLSYAPSSLVLLAEVFEKDAAYVNGRQVERLQPGSPSDLECLVTFNGFVDYTVVTPGVYTSIPSELRGTNLEIKFNSLSSGNTLWLDGWALIY